VDRLALVRLVIPAKLLFSLIFNKSRFFNVLSGWNISTATNRLWFTAISKV
jgi:hypothetical protein